MSYSVYSIKENCCGCTACANICPKKAITMCADSEGFLYPSVDGILCVECGLCKKVCDLQKKSENVKAEPTVFALKAEDSIRKNSTSGGAFTLLSDCIIERGGVVYGATFGDGMTVVHSRTTDKTGRDAQRGSKYVQSDLRDSFSLVKKDLANGLFVMFTGTACQIAGLKNYLFNVNTDKLLLVDILCHGVPSPLLFSEYIKFVEKKRKKRVSAYYSRAKDDGYMFNERIEYSDGSCDVKTMLGETWNHLFYSDNALRPCCYECKYTGSARNSDITIADFWGIEDISPEFYDKKGISLVIINSQKGKQAFDEICDEATLSLQTFEKAVVKNHNLITPTKLPKSREKFWNDVESCGCEHIFKTYGMYNPVRAVKRVVKKILGK